MTQDREHIPPPWYGETATEYRNRTGNMVWAYAEFYRAYHGEEPFLSREQVAAFAKDALN